MAPPLFSLRCVGIKHVIPRPNPPSVGLRQQCRHSSPPLPPPPSFPFSTPRVVCGRSPGQIVYSRFSKTKRPGIDKKKQHRKFWTAFFFVCLFWSVCCFFEVGCFLSASFSSRRLFFLNFGSLPFSFSLLVIIVAKKDNISTLVGSGVCGGVTWGRRCGVDQRGCVGHWIVQILVCNRAENLRQDELASDQERVAYWRVSQPSVPGA